MNTDEELRMSNSGDTTVQTPYSGDTTEQIPFTATQS
jgi:hypothetical protein